MSMRLCINTDLDRKHARLLSQVSEQLVINPKALRVLSDGSFELSCPLPGGYQTLMHSGATTLTGRLTSDFRLVSIAETSEKVSGGWSASCIPAQMYRIFLGAWLKHHMASSQEIGQLELLLS